MQDLIARIQSAQPRVERIDTAVANPETGETLGIVFMKRLSGEMRWHLLQIQSELEARGKKRIPPHVIAAVAMCNEDGSPAFSELADGATLLHRMHPEQLDELYDHALRVTGLGAKAKDVEEREKKSSSSQSDESGTNSPSSSEVAP